MEGLSGDQPGLRERLHVSLVDALFLSQTQGANGNAFRPDRRRLVALELDLHMKGVPEQPIPRALVQIADGSVFLGCVADEARPGFLLAGTGLDRLEQCTQRFWVKPPDI